jgi:hypothetical protein
MARIVGQNTCLNTFVFSLILKLFVLLWWVVCKPILVFSFGSEQAEQNFMKHT